MTLTINRSFILKQLKFIVTIVALSLVWALVIALASGFWFDHIMLNNTIKWDSRVEEFIIVVIAAPIFETLLLRVAVFKVIDFAAAKLKLTDKARDYLFLIFGSLLFSYMHKYNWLYMVATLVIGFLYNYSYLHFKKENFYPYLSVVCIHLLYNLCSLGLHQLGG